MDSASGREPETTNNRLIWDGTQFVPASQIDAELDAGAPSLSESSIRASVPGESSRGPSSSLGHLLGFSRSELAANRDGRMTGRQRLRLTVRAAWRMALAAPFAVLAAFAALNGHDFGPAALSAIATMVALYLLWRSFTFAVDVVEGDVSVVEGRIEKQEEYNYRSVQYYALVGELKTRVSGPVFGQLTEGLECRAFYAPSASALLSLEPLLDAAPPAPSRTFGPRAARSMPRGLETAILLALGGVLAMVLGAHLFVEARPATFSAYSGPISGFEQGRRTTYWIGLAGYDGQFRLHKPPYEFSPPLPDLTRSVGTTVTLWVDHRDRDVAAIYLDRMYRTDLFADPHVQERDMKGSGLAAMFLGLLLIAPLLITGAFQAIFLIPASPRRQAGPPEATALARPKVAELLNCLQALTSDQWEHAIGLSPLGESPIRPLIDPYKWVAIHDFVEKQAPNARLETLQGENAIAVVAFGDRLRPRDLVRMFGPFVNLVPCDSVGIKGPVAELCQHGNVQAVVDRFRSTLASHPDQRDLRAAMLRDKPELIEAALCLAALDADPDERSKLARNLIELAAFESGGVRAQIDTLKWLGDPVDVAYARELESGGRVEKGTDAVLGQAALHDLDRQRWERGLFTGLGCSSAEILFVFGAVVAVYEWFTTGGAWGAWAVLGVAAAFTPALGRIVYGALRPRFGGPVALIGGLPTTILAPVAVLAVGWTQIHNTGSVAALAVAAPVTTVLLALLSLRHSSADGSIGANA